MNGIQFLIGTVLIIVLLGGLWVTTENIEECKTDEDCIPNTSMAGVNYFCDNGICRTKPFGNPADAFCEEQGGKIEIRTDPRTEDGQYSVCILSNGTECDAWSYYYGGCDSCIIYCLKQPHVACVGNWNITGEYPNCNCKFVCTTTDKEFCSSNSDCVPSQCCHPNSCINKNFKAVCNVLCTQECRPGTMDCRQGKCVCNNNVCQVMSID
jgi:putative hemolysin